MSNNKYTYTIEKLANQRWYLTFSEKNKKGESLGIELMKCKDSDYKNSLPKLWYKNGYTDRILQTYWSIQTDVINTEGGCYGLYNPQHKLSEDKKRGVINFDWMFEATEDNKEKLINEVCRYFYSATGETATEKKNKKIRRYAEENNIDIFQSIPDGWQEIKGALTSPPGSIWISNMQPFTSTDRKKGLLLA